MTPKRYQFDNPAPSEPPHLPAYRPQPLPEQPVQYEGPQVVHQHVHQAPPDRTMQRIALGTGIGGGMTAGAVYFGPLLTAALTSMAVTLAVTALAIAVTAWAIVSVVRAVGGPEGTQAARNVRRKRRR